MKYLQYAYTLPAIKRGCGPLGTFRPKHWQKTTINKLMMMTTTRYAPASAAWSNPCCSCRCTYSTRNAAALRRAWGMKTLWWPQDFPTDALLDHARRFLVCFHGSRGSLCLESRPLLLIRRSQSQLFVSTLAGREYLRGKSDGLDWFPFQREKLVSQTLQRWLPVA